MVCARKLATANDLNETSSGPRKDICDRVFQHLRFQMLTIKRGWGFIIWLNHVWDDTTASQRFQSFRLCILIV